MQRRVEHAPIPAELALELCEQLWSESTIGIKLSGIMRAVFCCVSASSRPLAAEAFVRLQGGGLCGGMQPGCGSGAAGSSAAAPAVDSLGLAARLAALSPAELDSLVQAINQPASETQRRLAEMWQDPAVLEAGCAAIKAARQMPADAAERWGAGVAEHHCSKRDGNCLSSPSSAIPSSSSSSSSSRSCCLSWVRRGIALASRGEGHSSRRPMFAEG